MASTFNICKLAVCALLVLASTVHAQDRVYATKHRATVNKERKTIDANFGGHGDTRADSAQMAVLRDSVNLMLKDHEQRMRAQANGDVASAANNDGTVQAQKVSDSAVQATDKDGKKVNAGATNGRAMAMAGPTQRAKADLIQEGEVVRGGSAQQGTNQAQMNNELKDGQKVSHLKANNQYSADAAAQSRNQFNVRTADSEDAESRGAYALNSETLSKQDGQGKIDANNKDGRAQYAYQVRQDGQGEGHANLDQVAGGNAVLDRRTTGWRCQAVKDGESTCLDADGQIVGKVMTNAKGEATVVDKNGVVVGRGNARKVTDEKYEVVVSDGLATATTEQLKEYDCYSELVPGGSQEHKITIENVKVLVDGEEIDAEGGQTFSWPTCFDVEGEVTVPEGVDPSRLAFEYVGHVMPMGSMKCMDSMTCGRSCYYCNACQKERFLDATARITTDGDENPICDIHGGAGKQKVSMRVCPPPEMEEYAFCGGFDRHIVGNDYYKYDGSINAQIRVWLRPENEQALNDAFFTAITNSVTGAGFRDLLIAEYRLKNVVSGGLYVPTDNELREFYIKKNSEDKLMACRRGVIDYQVGGSNVNSNLVIDAFTNLPGKEVQLFSDEPCESWLTQQKAEYDAYLKDYQSRQGSAGGSSLLSLIQSRMLTNNVNRRLRL